MPRTDTKILSLNLTEQCNLRCIYCYQNERRNSKKYSMPFDVATAAIEDHLTKDDEFKKLIIQFIGGEVFLCWSLVRDLINWTIERNQNWKKKYVFFIDTNGTLLNDEIKTWLYERRKNVIVGLSLDGTPEAHNLNRSGSYSRIVQHLSFFAKTWPSQPVKMTISPQTIPMIFDGIIHIMRQGLLVAANVPLEDIWGPSNEKSRHLEEFKREIEKLVDFFGNNPEVPLPSIINLPISAITSEKDRNRPWCGSGRNMVAIEADGKTIPCNRYAAMSFDHSLFNRPLSPITSCCRYCMFKPACQTCEAHNWEVNGNPKNRTTFHCEFIKLQIWGTAQVHAMRLEKKIQEIKLMTDEERLAHTEEFALIQKQFLSIAVILEWFQKHDNLSDVPITINGTSYEEE